MRTGLLCTAQCAIGCTSRVGTSTERANQRSDASSQRSLYDAQDSFDGREELGLDRSKAAFRSVPVHDKAEGYRRITNHNLPSEALGVDVGRRKLPTLGIGRRIRRHG